MPTFRRPLIGWILGWLTAIAPLLGAAIAAPARPAGSVETPEPAPPQVEALLYFHRIRLAEDAWTAGQVARAREILEECPRPLRHWEWHYLKRLSEGSRLTLQAKTAFAPLCVAFSPDGSQIAAVGSSVTIWKAATGETIRTLAQAGHALAFSPDGRQLAVAGSDGIRIWKLDTGQTVHTFAGRTGGRSGLAFSPDGKQLAAASLDAKTNGISLWDLETGTVQRTLRGHLREVVAVAFSADGKLLASGSMDGTAKLWDLGSGDEIRTLRGRNGEVRTVTAGASRIHRGRE
jgi:WD40 repeat protein